MVALNAESDSCFNLVHAAIKVNGIQQP